MDIEWVDWNPVVAERRADVEVMVSDFKARQDHPAGRAATAWLKEKALTAHPGCVTRLLVADGKVQGYYAVSASEVELRQKDRKKIEADHPRQGAVLITWLARAQDATIPGVGELLLKHAVGVARAHATAVGASVIALDPFDEATAKMWRDRYGFRASSTKPRRDALSRMWAPLFPR